jgi:hypothetical protein
MNLAHSRLVGRPGVRQGAVPRERLQLGVGQPGEDADGLLAGAGRLDLRLQPRRAPGVGRLRVVPVLPEQAEGGVGVLAGQRGEGLPEEGVGLAAAGLQDQARASSW